MDWKKINLKTPISQIPKIWDYNFSSTKRYLDLFYDASAGLIIKPVQTSGRVKGARGEFVTVTVDNLIVKNQFTNLYQNSTTADVDFVNYYNGYDVSTRVAVPQVDPSDASVYNWPYEPSTYSWVDVNTPYIKITNDVSYGFQQDTLGQEFRLILDTSVATSSPYTVLLDSSLGGERKLTVAYTDREKTWIKLILTSFDVSLGPKWTVKEYGGDYTIS